MLEAIGNVEQAEIYLGLKYYLPERCTKCNSKDCFSYQTVKPKLFTCTKCNTIIKMKDLPIRDSLLLARLIWRQTHNPSGLDRLAEAFKVKKSKVLKCLWWSMNKFNNEKDRLINNTNRKNFLCNEIDYMSFKIRLLHDNLRVRYEARHDSRDN